MNDLSKNILLWVVIAVVVASLFEIIPTFLIKSNVPTIATVKPYTPLELAGRDIYLAEGCYNCHSQMIRPIRSETVRYGEYSKALQMFQNALQMNPRNAEAYFQMLDISRPSFLEDLAGCIVYLGKSIQDPDQPVSSLCLL